MAAAERVRSLAGVDEERLGRWVRRITRRGVATAILGGVLLTAGLLWRYPGVIGLGGAFVGLAGLATVSVLRRAPVHMRRSVWPREVTRSEPCDATLRVRRLGGLLAPNLDVVDRIGGVECPVTVAWPSSGRGTEVTYSIPTGRRGLLSVGPLLVRRRGVGGLAEGRAELADVIQVRVLPRVLPVRGLPIGVRRGHLSADERAERGGTDLVGLREYVPGDDLRRLHWATSARTGTLIVREDADPAQAHLTVLLDDRAASYVDGDMEDAVEVATSLAVAAANAGHGVHLLTACEQVDVSVVAATDHATLAPARHLVSLLAEVVALDEDRDPVPIPPHALDVVVAVTGDVADHASLLREAGRATVGVLAIVDRAQDRPDVTMAGSVVVLRGRSSVDLLHGWNTAVAG